MLLLSSFCLSVSNKKMQTDGDRSYRRGLVASGQQSYLAPVLRKELVLAEDNHPNRGDWMLLGHGESQSERPSISSP